jgi:hypothetical protein
MSIYHIKRTQIQSLVTVAAAPWRHAACLATLALGLGGFAPTAQADYASTVQGFTPVGYWRLSEMDPAPVDLAVAVNTGTGGIALDGAYTNSATRGVTGALVGSSDPAAAFNGSNQRMLVPYSAELNPAAPWTTEIWVQPASLLGSGDLRCAVSNGQFASPRSGWLIYQDVDKWNLRTYSGTGTAIAAQLTSAAGTASAGTWHHLVVVNDATTLHLYVDGVEVGTGVAVGATAPGASGGTCVGARADSAFYWAGMADELALYPTALSAADVAAHYANATNPSPSTPYATLVGSSNPVGYYRLNDVVVGPTAVNSGSLLAAADGNYGLGTTPGQEGPSPTSVPVLTGLEADNVACAFNAGQINCGNNVGLNLNQVSVAAWIKVGTLLADMNIVAKGSSLWRLQIDGSSRHLKWVCPGGGVTGIKFVNDGQWHHVVAVAGASGSALYVDGVLDGLDATPVASLPSTTDPVTIGSGTGARWNGSIDEVAIFGSALSEANAMALYAAAEPPIKDMVVDAAVSTVVPSANAVWTDVGASATVTVTCLSAGGTAVDGKIVELASNRGGTDEIAPTSGVSDPNGQVIFTVSSTTAGAAIFSATDTSDPVEIAQTAPVAFTARPPAVTEYVNGCTIVKDWDFTGSTLAGWASSRNTILTPAGVKLGAEIPGVTDHGAWVGMIRIAPPAGITYVDSGVEITYYAPYGPPPTDGYEFLSMWTDSPRDGFTVIKSGGAPYLRGSAITRQQDRTDASWTIPTDAFGAGLDGLHTMALMRGADGNVKTYLDGVLVNTRPSADPSSALQWISIGWNVNGNMYMPLGSIISQVRAFNVIITVGAVDPNTSTVQASPSTLLADGTAQSTITVTLKDVDGNPIGGKDVSLAKTGGDSGAPNLTPSSATSGVDGKAIFTVTSTDVGAYVFTATDTTDSVTLNTSPTITFLAGAPEPPVTNGLVCWYSADYGVTTDGGGVQTWDDLSGNEHHATRGSSGSPTLAPGEINSKPAVHLRGNQQWFNCAGSFFTKEQYVVVRSPNAVWSGSGSFLGRKGNGNSGARNSSYNLANATTGFWQDHFPTAVSKNGTPVAFDRQPNNGPGFQLGTITEYMVLKIVVDATADEANLAAFPANHIGQNDNLGSCDMDIAEIIGFDHELTAVEQNTLGAYFTDKYGITVAEVALSSACDITTFGANIAGSSASINTTGPTTGTVVLTVAPATTPEEVAALAPTYTLSAHAACNNQPNDGVTLPSPVLSTTTSVPYIVIAEDSTTKTYAVTVLPGAPPNDNFADAIALPGNSGTRTGTGTNYGTTETDEPAINGALSTVWFKWTCPADGNLTISTLGSRNLVGGEWDAMIGLYTGASVEALTALPGTPRDTGYEEITTVAVTAGTTYFLQAAGYENSVAGNILLTWTFVGTGGYDGWATQYAGGGTAGEDYNNDGVQNGIAYFMGMNGIATNPGVVGGKVTWPHVGEVASFEVQVSDNLTGWEPATTGVDTSDPGQVVFTLQPSATPRKFCRLVVTP